MLNAESRLTLLIAAEALAGAKLFKSAIVGIATATGGGLGGSYAAGGVGIGANGGSGGGAAGGGAVLPGGLSAGRGAGKRPDAQGEIIARAHHRAAVRREGDVTDEVGVAQQPAGVFDPPGLADPGSAFVPGEGQHEVLR